MTAIRLTNEEDGSMSKNLSNARPMNEEDGNMSARANSSNERPMSEEVGRTTAKAYLEQARQLNELIDSSLREIVYWRDKASSVSSADFEAHYSANRPTEAPFVRCIEEIDEIRRGVAERARRYMRMRDEISRRIDGMRQPNERALLRYRYLDGYTWDEIEAAMDISERTAMRLHKSALVHFPVPRNEVAQNAG